MLNLKPHYARAWIDLTPGEMLWALGKIIDPIKENDGSLKRSFETEFACFIGTQAAMTFSNCRSALYFSLKALEFNEGDEIILPAFSFWVDTAMVLLAGLKPVFVDVDFKTMNIDTNKITQKITSRTRAIIPTHLNGRIADMHGIMEIAKKHTLRVIEDCARACGGFFGGQRAGAFDIGVFSFGYGKSFYGFGGGMVTSNDGVFIKKLQAIKKNFFQYGRKEKAAKLLKGMVLKFLTNKHAFGWFLFPKTYDYQLLGEKKYQDWFKYQMPPYNEVPKEFQTDMFDAQLALGRKQLKRIDQTNEKRIEHAKILNRELQHITEIVRPQNSENGDNVFVHYAIYYQGKDELQKYLFQNRIDAQDESAMCVPSFKRFINFALEPYTSAGKLNGKVLFLPTHPNLTYDDILYVADRVKQFFRGKK